DSHTSTHGAFGALAFGIGTSEVEHVLASQCLWQKKPKTMQIVVDGELPLGATAKDIALGIIGRIGSDGATGYVIEYRGSAIRALSMEGRMTLCNMSIEAGARAGMIAPDENSAPSEAERAATSRALEYMDLKPGTAIEDIVVDRVFIGSCTNARIEDLRATAELVRGYRVHPRVQAMVVPGSQQVKRAAE